MTFEETLTATIEMLQRHGRLSYGALRRQFDVDDAFVNDLRVELVDVRKLAITEGDSILVWTGEPADAEPKQVSALPAEARESKAERRHLSVMFCDLVDSTPLAERLDVEQLGELYEIWQDACAEEIKRFGGHVADYRGDGVFVYFGYPSAQEDGPRRAIRAALDILAMLPSLNARLRENYGATLSVRIGIHHGLVLLSDLGGRHAQQQFAFGETPNIAARVQSLAGPNEVLITGAVYALARGFFDVEELGEQSLKGVSNAVAVFRVVRETGAESKLDVVPQGALTPFVARGSEFAMLKQRWELAVEGYGQACFLSGEAGIGKSRLAGSLREYACGRGARSITFRCSPYNMASPLYPVIHHIQRSLQFALDDPPETKAEKLENGFAEFATAESDAIAILGSLLSVEFADGRHALAPHTPARLRERTLEVLVLWLLWEAERSPLLLTIEDLHWADPSTLEFLSFVLEQLPSSRILTAMTYRPEFQPPWPQRSNMTSIALGRLTNAESELLLLRTMHDKGVPSEVTREIIGRADGIPLFIEELATMIVESKFVRDEGSTYVITAPVAQLPIPATLQDSLMARLDRIPEVRETAQLAAALGREFSFKMIQAVSPLDDAALRTNIKKLIDNEVLQQRGIIPNAVFHFRHALIHDAAYGSMLKATRQQYHRRIVTVVEERFPQLLETQPEVAARHYTEAGMIDRAITQWRTAGERALQRCANHEALSDLDRGLELLRTTADSPEKLHQEVLFEISRGAALLITRGQASSEVEHAYARALELSEALGDTRERWLILFGLCRYYMARSVLKATHEISTQLIALAERLGDPILLLGGRMALGFTLYHMGELTEALRLVEEGYAAYEQLSHEDRESAMFFIGQNPGMGCQFCAAFVFWLIAKPEESLVRQTLAFSIARELDSPFQTATALSWEAILYHLRGDIDAELEAAQAALALAEEHGFPLWTAVGRLQCGAALAICGGAETALELVRSGVALIEEQGHLIFKTRAYALLTEACLYADHVDEGLAAARRGLTTVTECGERWWEAELHRLLGELLLKTDPPDVAGAERSFHEALAIARRASIRAFELRAQASIEKAGTYGISQESTAD